MRPATSLIGVSSGSVPWRSRTVSYAMPITFGLEQFVGQIGQRRQVQIGKQHQPFAEVDVLLLDGLLDLDDHVRLAPDVAGVAHHLRAGILVFVIGKAGLRARPASPPAPCGPASVSAFAPGRSNAHARFVILDLLWERR